MLLRRIEVVPYNPEWPCLFEQEAINLLALFGQEVLAIHHIGRYIMVLNRLSISAIIRPIFAGLFEAAAIGNLCT